MLRAALRDPRYTADGLAESLAGHGFVPPKPTNVSGMGGDHKLSAAVVFVQDLQRSADVYREVVPSTEALRRCSSAAP